MSWWKEYIGEWKRNLFLILQMVLVLFFVNSEVSFLAEEYKYLTYATGTDSNLYFYENAMGTLTDDWGYEGFCHAVEKLKELDGLEEVAWQARVSCNVAGYQTDEFSGVSCINLSPAFWKGVQYRLEEGRWFLEQDAEDNRLPVIIGGGLSKQYRTGDTLTLSCEGGEEEEAIVIGSLGTDFYMIGDGLDIRGRNLSSYAAYESGEGGVILSNDMKWFEKFREQAVYPYLSVMVKIREGADLSEYERYGVLISFRQVMKNTEEKCRNFLWEAIQDEAVWIFVVIFGVFGVSYATAKSMRYTWGIYSLLGMTGNQLLGRLMLKNGMTYLLGGIVANLLAPCIGHTLNYYYSFSVVNVAATGILAAVLFLISYFCNRYIKKIEPKEILTQIKE